MQKPANLEYVGFNQLDSQIYFIDLFVQVQTCLIIGYLPADLFQPGMVSADILWCRFNPCGRVGGEGQPEIWPIFAPVFLNQIGRQATIRFKGNYPGMQAGSLHQQGINVFGDFLPGF